jgi:ABC-type multidrug transport system fused ATPase/permease subunit
MDIMNDVKQVGQGETMIVVAHLLPTMIPEFDEIIALDEGKVVKRQNHQELFKKQCWHAERLTTQKQQLDEAVRWCHQIWSKPSMAHLASRRRAV